MNYPYQNKTEYHKVFQKLEAYTSIENVDETLMLFYFSGESFIKGGKIVVDLGAGPQPIEKNIFSLCERATNLTTWAIWDCDREENVAEALALGKQPNIEQEYNGYVPIVSTYASKIGESKTSDS